MNKLTTFVIGVIGGVCSSAFITAKFIGDQYDIHCDRIEKNADKFSDYYTSTLQWVRIHQKGKTLNDYFKKNGYKSISVYGMNDIAYAIIDELKETDTVVEFCIDRNADNLFLEMKTLRPDQELPNVDVCVVALPDLYEEISNELSKKMKCPIVSIEDVVWDI